MSDTYCKGVDLPSVHGCRLHHSRHDWVVGFDLNSSYYHGDYHESTYTWMGFSISDEELPLEAIEYSKEFWYATVSPYFPAVSFYG